MRHFISRPRVSSHWDIAALSPASATSTLKFIHEASPGARHRNFVHNAGNRPKGLLSLPHVFLMPLVPSICFKRVPYIQFGMEDFIAD